MIYKSVSNTTTTSRAVATPKCAPAWMIRSVENLSPIYWVRKSTIVMVYFSILLDKDIRDSSVTNWANLAIIVTIYMYKRKE